MLKLHYLIISLFIILSGCSNSIYVDDGVPRNEEGNALINSDGNAIIVTQKLAGYTLEGHTFQYYNRWTGINNGATEEIIILTKNVSGYLRMTLVKSNTAPVLMEIFENTTTTSNGTLQDIYNRNRYEGHPNLWEIYYTPTITTDGTKIFLDSIEGDKGESGLCGQDVCTWVLKPNETYLIRITNLGGNGANFGFKMLWTEIHDPLVN